MNDFPSYHLNYNIDHNPHDNKANDNDDSTYALPEKTKRGPPTNKNISVRNIMAQISNMSKNENAGFKSEYHVRFTFFNIMMLFIFIVYSYNIKFEVKK